MRTKMNQFCLGKTEGEDERSRETEKKFPTALFTAGHRHIREVRSSSTPTGRLFPIGL